MTELLRLRAETAEDLPALSALVQDMAILANDIAFDARRRRLSLMGNRYRWEAATPTRVRTAVRVDHVQGLQHRAMPDDPRAVLALLAMAQEGEHLVLTFAGGSMLRARIETLDVTMDDVAGPWGARAVPDHGG